MGLFNRKKTNHIEGMKTILKAFMLQYIHENPHAADGVMPIFSSAETIIRGISEKKMHKTLTRNNVNEECSVLNIIQNCAMTELKPQSGAAFLINDNHALDLYQYVNKQKLCKGFITKQQFDENEMLGTKLSLHSPLGEWY
ncbi:MAG: hypothetical protein PUE61_05010 [Clostridiales bacterium]|nr:hypothetical protein [Clostridiales bacterium]